MLFGPLFNAFVAYNTLLIRGDHCSHVECYYAELWLLKDLGPRKVSKVVEN